MKEGGAASQNSHCENPYKHSYYNAAQSNSPLPSYQLQQSNVRSRGNLLNPDHPLQVGDYKESLHQKKSDVTMPFNIVATDLLRCMNCNAFVRCIDMASHLSSAHGVSSGEDLYYGGSDHDYGKPGSRDIYEESAPRVNYTVETAERDPMVKQRKIQLVPQKPREHFHMFQDLQQVEKKYKATNFKPVKYTRAHEIVEDNKEVKVGMVIEPAPLKSGIDFNHQNCDKERTSLARGLVLQGAQPAQASKPLRQLSVDDLGPIEKPALLMQGEKDQEQEIGNDCGCYFQCGSKGAAEAKPPQHLVQRRPEEYRTVRPDRLASAVPLSRSRSRKTSVTYQPVVTYEQQMVPRLKTVVRYQRVIQNQPLPAIFERDEGLASSRQIYDGEYDRGYYAARRELVGDPVASSYKRVNAFQGDVMVDRESRIIRRGQQELAGVRVGESVLMGILPIQAHQMEKWHNIFIQKFKKEDKQKFDESVTEAIHRGIRTWEEYKIFLKNQ